MQDTFTHICPAPLWKHTHAIFLSLEGHLTKPEARGKFVKQRASNVISLENNFATYLKVVFLSVLKYNSIINILNKLLDISFRFKHFVEF